MLLYLTFQLSTHCPLHFLFVHPFLARFTLFDLLHVSEHLVLDCLKGGGWKQTDQQFISRQIPDRL